MGMYHVYMLNMAWRNLDTRNKEAESNLMIALTMTAHISGSFRFPVHLVDPP